MNRPALAMFFLLCVVSPAVPQSAALGIDKLSPYSGTWKLEIEHLDTKFSKARKESSIVRNDCWRSEEYFACHQFADGKSAAVIVFTYNEKEDAFRSYIIPAEGGEPTAGKLLISGNVWTFPWVDKDEAGKTIYLRVVNVWTGLSTIDYRKEFSEDGVHWTVAAKGRERKTL